MKTSRSLTRRLPAGIVDASLASLATFAVGLAAVNLLPDRERGVYAVFFTAYLLGSVLASNLILIPAEVEVVALPVEARVPVIRRTLALGLGPAMTGAVAALLAAVVAAPLTDATVIVPFTVTTAAACVLSPLQDHVRKMLHIGTKSWLAASISAIQLIVAVVAILVMMRTDLALSWIPFGALSIANLASLSFGWVLTLNTHRGNTKPDHFQFSDLVRRGRWLVLQAVAPSLAAFVAAAIITHLATPEALGFAEAARVVAQPIVVLATGLGAVLNPRAVEAAMKRDWALAQHNSRIFLAIIGITGGVYLAIAGWDWTLNPMPHIVPSAYDVRGLVAVSILGNLAGASVFLQFNGLMGAQKERALTAISWLVSPILVIVALTAGTTDAFARPLGRLAQGIGRYAVYERVLRTHYGLRPTDRNVDEMAARDHRQ